MSGNSTQNPTSGPPPAPGLLTGQPGVIVPLGSLITPGGDQGPAGVAGPAGPTKVSTDVSNRAVIGSDSLIYVPPYPYADATQGGLMRQLSGKTTDFVDGTDTCQDLGAATRNGIWYVRQRSFNSVSNSNMEVDQRLAGTAITPTGTGSITIDRWNWGQASTVTGRVTIQQVSAAPAYGIAIPGVNYFPTSKFLSIKLTTGQAALATGDVIYVIQQIEGPRFRELAADVTSLSLLVMCDVALHFTAFLKDQGAAQSLVLPCSIPAGVWTLIQLPSLAMWPNAGVFSSNPGVVGYQLGICLGSGATFTAPAANVWQAGNFMAAAGGDNFLGQALNTVFRWAVVQHEPGPVCSYLMDKDFGLNLAGCQRYFFKTYDQGVKPGTATPIGAIAGQQIGTTAIAGARFQQPMAKTPTVTIYNQNTGAANSVFLSNAVSYAVSSVNGLGQGGFFYMTTATLPAVAAGANGQYHVVADTGW